MSPARDLASPQRWTRDELRTARDLREETFRQSWRRDGPGRWAEVCADLLPQVEAMFHATGDLSRVAGDVFLDDPAAWQLLRYACAPVLSEENFWTLVGSPKSKVVKPEYADDAAEVINLVIDPVRFPWIASNRQATDRERYASILATVALLASQRVGTGARGERSKRQEAAVGAALASAGYEIDPSNARIEFLDNLERGRYSTERRVANSKCDVPVRLRDGRLLTIECKVSIGPKNGWKRLNRETGGKAEAWRTHFGAAQVVSVVVIDGVFDLGCLLQAQNEQRVAIFWEDDLGPLTDFVARAT